LAVRFCSNLDFADGLVVLDCSSSILPEGIIGARYQVAFDSPLVCLNHGVELNTQHLQAFDRRRLVAGQQVAARARS
jgi:hypothetical protein